MVKFPYSGFAPESRNTFAHFFLSSRLCADICAGAKRLSTPTPKDSHQQIATIGRNIGFSLQQIRTAAPLH